MKFSKFWFKVRCHFSGYCPKHDHDIEFYGTCPGCIRDSRERRNNRNSEIRAEYEFRKRAEEANASH